MDPPELKGYLNKYTNVAKGYNTRWFVLKDGVLSCKWFQVYECFARVLTALQTTDTKKTRLWRAGALSR